MDRTERFYKIDSLLQANQTVSVDRMLTELEVSLATFKRDRNLSMTMRHLGTLI